MSGLSDGGAGEREALAPSAPAAAPRGSIVESFRGCGIGGGGGRAEREELRQRVAIPGRILAAMAAAMRSKDPNSAAKSAATAATEEEEEEDEEDAAAAAAAAAEVEGRVVEEDLPEAPMVAFVNSRSGGRHGPILKGRLQELIGEEQVYDLLAVEPSEFVWYGLGCLENLADLGDCSARVVREKLRIMVAGGDGTVGWVLGCLAELYVQKREPVPPIAIIPLGTGNDLSRSFSWGPSFPFAWRSAVKRSLYKAMTGPICRLDSWDVTVSMPAGEEADVELPHSLKPLGMCAFDKDGYIEGDLPEKVSCFNGVFYNYFSIGMDAQVAYGFHQLRDEKPFLAPSPLANKLIYAGYTCKQGWFFTPCISDPSLRGLKNILQLSIKKIDSSDWEQIPVPSSVRAIVALNLHNYGSGRNPWGNLKPDYLEKRGFVEAQVDDGLLEIFGLKQGWHASLVMVELISAKHIAQAAAIRLEIRGGQWRDAYMQMDGEPWKQTMSRDYSIFVDIKRAPFQSLIISGE
ncbi:diacylglycerol kinase 4-like [Ananas comosus]|uniref:Diacylglycerol kinase n=1 Tax=Ananas comosus TaxID=4615 RepID=A0A6P5GUI8_ANACO|nr:diacylglycerol kinase 4-like [Ananas comosus]